jgi:glycosyltransferase involved in cell wall biosynthesis
MFNAQLFRQLNNLTTNNHYQNICLVPSWKLWQWPAIRRWKAPGQASQSLQEKNIEQKPAKSAKEESCISDEGGKTNSPSRTSRASVQISSSRPDASGQPSTVYLPVFYLPFIGRSLNWWFYYRALRKKLLGCQVAKLSSESPNGRHLTTQQPSNQTTAHATRGVILASWLYPDAVAAARVAREMDVPVWLRVHGTDRFHLDDKHRRRLILEAVDSAQGVICNANSVAEYMVKRGVPAEKIHIIRNGADTSLFKYREKASSPSPLGGEGGGEGFPDNGMNKPGNPSSLSLNAPETPHLNPLPQGERKSGDPTILFIGNLVPVKGPDILLKAFARIIEQKPAKAAKKEGILPQRHGDTEKRMLREFQAASTPSEIPATLSGGIPKERGDIQQSKPLLPLYFSLKKRCGNFGHGTPWAKYPQHWFSLLLSSRCLGVSVVKSSSSRTLRASVQTLSSPRLIVIGSGPLRATLERQAQQLGISDHVQFLGNRPHSEVALWMNRADVLCLTSRSEGMPNVVVEALVSGLPVVATAVGACPDLLANEPAARICPSEDVEAIAEALKSVLEQSVDRQALASRHAAQYSWSRQAEGLLRLMGVNLVHFTGAPKTAGY